MPQLGTGAARAMDKWAIARPAKKHGWHPADLDGIRLQESGSFGWFANGQIKMLPEPHEFRRQLPRRLRAKAIRKGLATRGYRATRSSGHYRRMRGPKPRYALLQKWIDFCVEHGISVNAAYGSCSVGDYQIMSYHGKRLGFKDAKDMWDQFCESQAVQLEAFVTFLLKARLKKAIQVRDFLLVEKRYNGGGQKGAYARGMRRKADKLRRTKWKNWPNMDIPPAPVASGTVKDPIEQAVKKGAKGLGGTAGAGTGAGTAAPEVTGIPWDVVLGVGGGIVIACIVIYFGYGWLRDRLDDRVPQADDDLPDEVQPEGIPT